MCFYFFQIKVRVNSHGVGQNLQDHVIGLVGPFTVNNDVEGKHLTYLPSRDSSPADLLQYLGTGSGPLSQAGVMASGFIASNISKLEQKSDILWPDMQLILLGIPKDKDGVETLAKLYNLKKEIAQEFYEPVYGKDSFHIMSIVSRPRSRGSIQLASADPKVAPLIDPNYYHDPFDIALTVEGMY